VRIVHLPVQPGIQFHLLSVDWAGNHAIPTDALQKFVTTAPGAIADLPRLREGLDELTKAYRSRGYMAVQHALVPHLTQQPRQSPSQSRLWRATFTISENSPSKASTRKRGPPARRWTLRPGEPFDASYEMTFMKETRTSSRRAVGPLPTYIWTSPTRASTWSSGTPRHLSISPKKV